MSKVKPYIPHYKREAGNRNFTYAWSYDTDRCGNRFHIRKVFYTNKKDQDCEEVIQVVHLGKAQ